MNRLSSHNPQVAACQQRRTRLAQLIQAKSAGGVVILSTAEEKARNRDSDFPYRHDSDFFYLTGFDEPGATLVMLIQKTSFERS